ncbi:HAUS augmin-like complex subunit 5 [Cyprinus carpio]|uniref:HAUS augmin-like complex subunit 5 n=1 Tax=Cyprinus carpio TaxID=7962 RepID=A0A9Q9YEX4_CYPCA|nr:HAUS augmin-like complex subunit 5 [Cyprinus carpio]
MASLSQELKRWAIEEIELPAARLPDDGYLKTLCVGPGTSIWKYVTQHVYKERNVRVMRGNIQWYKVLQDKELKQLKNQNKDARRLELQREIDALQTELNQLDTKISRVEDQIATEEQNMNRNWGDFMDGRHRQILLDSFRQRCSEERNVLLEDTHVIGTQRHALEELSKKAEVKLVFGPSDGSDSEAGADPLVLKDVRELCSERVLFFQGLLESELNVNPSSEFTHEQRKAAIQHWMSAVQNALRSHPPNQVLSALQALTSRQQVALEEKIAALNVERDISDLRFRYESDHLIDASAEQKEELTPVRSLLQSAWEEVEQSYFELAQAHNRCGQLETELTALMRKAETAHYVPFVSRCVFELEMEGVKQAAVRDHIREQCAQLQLQAREGQDAIRTPQTQYKIFIEIIHIPKKISTKSKTKDKKFIFWSFHCAGQFVQEKLNPQFCSVIKAITIHPLDRRVMKGLIKTDGGSLVFLCQAPEELWSQAAVLRLELRNLRRLLHLYSESSADLQKLTAQLPSPDQQTLVQRVKIVDDEILQTLLPRARELTQRCSKGLLYTEQVKTAITHWWEQPGQFALPEMQILN